MEPADRIAGVPMGSGRGKRVEAPALGLPVEVRLTAIAQNQAHALIKIVGKIK